MIWNSHGILVFLSMEVGENVFDIGEKSFGCAFLHFFCRGGP